MTYYIKSFGKIQRNEVCVGFSSKHVCDEVDKGDEDKGEVDKGDKGRESEHK